MAGVFFFTMVAAASSSQYDGDLSRPRAGEEDCVQCEVARLTAGQSNWGKQKDGHFRRSTRIGNAPELAPRDGRPVSPMNGGRRMRLFAGSYLETWSGAMMMLVVSLQGHTH